MQHAHGQTGPATQAGHGVIEPRAMRTLLIALLSIAGAARATTLDELLAKNLAARGGAANLQKLQTLRLTGRASFAGRGGAKIESAWAQVQKRRRQVPLGSHPPGPHRGRGLRRQGGLELSPFQGRREPERASQDDARGAGAGGRPRRPAGRLAREGPAGRVPRHRGRRRHAGAQAARRAQGRRRPVRLPRSRLLPRDPHRQRAAQCAAPSEITETDLGGYEQVAGVWIPFSIESGQQGRAADAALHASSTPRPTSSVDDALFRFRRRAPVRARSSLAGPTQAAPPCAAPPPAPPHAAASSTPASSPASARATSARRR